MAALPERSQSKAVQGRDRTPPLTLPQQPSSPRDWSLIRLVDSQYEWPLLPARKGIPGWQNEAACRAVYKLASLQQCKSEKKETESSEDLERKGRRSRPVCLEEKQEKGGGVFSRRLRFPSHRKFSGIFLKGQFTRCLCTVPRLEVFVRCV